MRPALADATPAVDIKCAEETDAMDTVTPMGETDHHPATDDDRTFGQIVSDRRAELGWSQGDLAKRLDVGQQTVSRWEAGLAHPRPRTVREVAMTLGVPSAPLLMKAGYLTKQEMPGALESPERLDRLSSKLSALSDRDRRAVERMIDAMLHDGDSG